jgi:hypothetical protein
MGKRSIIPYITILLLIASECCFFNNYVMAKDPSGSERLISITPQENMPEKALFIKSKYEKNKKYTSIEDEKVFKEVLVGVWLLPPEGGIELKSDGRFEAKNANTKKVAAGFWKFEDGMLKISSNRNKWEAYTVKKHGLSFRDVGDRKNIGDYSFAYSYSISFDKMICGMSSVLQISFYTK